LVTLVLACLPSACVDQLPPSPPASGRGALRAAAFIVVALFLLGSWGFWRLSHDTAAPTDIRVRVVQPNVEQAHKWDDAGRERRFQQLLDLTSAPAAVAPRVIVWPETASTFYLAEDEDHRRAIAAHVPVDAYLLTGVIRRRMGNEGRIHYANSLLAIDSTSRIVAAYDKFHLVPFGEYIPFRRVLPLRTLANLGVDFTAGEGLQTLRIDGLPSFSPLICYEAIFSGEVARRDDRPSFLVNVTNDGWYGNTAGPYQHFVSARLRAIEEGLPLIRAANTGISGVVDAYGRLVAELDLGKTGFVDANLPTPIPPTVFSRYGGWVLWGMVGVLVVVASVARYRVRRP